MCLPKYKEVKIKPFCKYSVKKPENRNPVAEREAILLKGKPKQKEEVRVG